jgi:flagellar protein FliS
MLSTAYFNLLIFNMNLHKKYKTASVTTGNKTQQMVFVFDEVIKILYQVKKNMEANEIEERHKNLSKAIDVFYAMRTGIDIENGGEPAKHLDNFYILTIKAMEDLNIHNKSNIEEVDRLSKSIREVRDSISEAAKAEGLM